MSVIAANGNGDELPGTAASLRPFVLGLAGLVAVVLGAWMLVRSSSSPDVAQIEVYGPLHRVGVRDVERALQPLLDEDFLALKLEKARAQLAQLPWVARTRVERVWPGTLRVHVWEREPFCRWNAASLLDTEAQAFTPKPAEIPPGLVQLGGTPGHEREVMETYQRLSLRLRTTPFALGSLVQDARGEWRARTLGGIELRFGRGLPDEKLDMLLGPALRKLESELAQVSHIDLRYTNGFSVGWRSQPINGGSGSETHG